MKKPLALDADGVLLDYNEAYARAWERAFGVRPKLVNPNAYWAQDRFGVPLLEGDELAAFEAAKDFVFWSTMAALPGAVEACRDLVAAGHDLVVVSALAPQHLGARWANLMDLGFPVRQLFSAPREAGLEVSPKAKTLSRIKPLAFVEDYLPYFKGVPKDGTHLALITREPEGTPNTGPDLDSLDSQHPDLGHFARWWLGR